MKELATLTALFVTLMSSIASAEIHAPPKKHLVIYKSEQNARHHCPNDTIVWANTRTHVLYLPGDRHHLHTHGGYACESQARALGYRGPTTHV
jgi:hypothetical protein